jgi:hypothetical protein
MFNFQTLQHTDVQIKAYALVEIENFMRHVGRSIKDVLDIEMPILHVLEEIGNRLMNEEMDYDSKKQKVEHDAIYCNLNENQKVHLMQL